VEPMDIEQANTEATQRMMEARPVVVGLGKALDVIPGMREDLLLHAGPPITWERASGPMRGAITGALIFEGKAKDESIHATTTRQWDRWPGSSALPCRSTSWRTKPTATSRIPT
jgi:hypothetical protein